MIELKTLDDEYPKIRIKGSAKQIASECVLSFMALARVFSDITEEPFERAMFTLFQQGMKYKELFPDTGYRKTEYE